MILLGQDFAGLGIAPVGGLEQPGDLRVIKAGKGLAQHRRILLRQREAGALAHQQENHGKD